MYSKKKNIYIYAHVERERERLRFKDRREIYAFCDILHLKRRHEIYMKCLMSFHDKKMKRWSNIRAAALQQRHDGVRCVVTRP